MTRGWGIVRTNIKKILKGKNLLCSDEVHIAHSRPWPSKSRRLVLTQCCLAAVWLWASILELDTKDFGDVMMQKNVLGSVKIYYFHLYNPILITRIFFCTSSRYCHQNTLGPKAVWQNEKNSVYLAEKGGGFPPCWRCRLETWEVRGAETG